MPELPDITVYREALEERILGRILQRIRLPDIFVLRTAQPPVSALEGKRLEAVERLGKRLVLGFAGDLWLVLHLMIAGRLHWSPAAEPPAAPRTKRPPAKRSGQVLALLEFAEGTLSLTEAGTKRRASLHLVSGRAGLDAHRRTGLDVFAATPAAFAEALTRENHTLKRALTDPRLFDGIGNAYSDEILHAARLSPVALTRKLETGEIDRLREASRAVLKEWTERLRAENAGRFPENVTAFRPEMAVHGKYGQPCPVCGTLVQRIRYAENEVNYCPRCQTGGKLLADRSLSRLLKEDWPRTIDEAESRER